ncbi:TatD family hydrolase [Microaerobacter geothermalis]|uniref:TatD family hydrolase n=1 Tax=Microaerobacter geothermalis TaxID=674972 RepID=UPI001F3A023A|nr:TatD family hydrolase [Microaerobacter geothermalis]MCF6095011.1 TatD family hydrolase [Microaerobacter geothermalis]
MELAYNSNYLKEKGKNRFLDPEKVKRRLSYYTSKDGEEMKIIDSHIHLDSYEEEIRTQILDDLEENHISALIAVSTDFESSKKNLLLHHQYANVYPAFGYHPEQSLPSEEKLAAFLAWIRKHKRDLVAVGEVGLPYFLRRKKENTDFSFEAYIDVLEKFILLAKELDKPIILHAIYDDAPIACDLLEKHGVQKAHFHWFKGDPETISRMIKNGYVISVTPDILYEPETQVIAKQYPLEQLLVETDGPWPFKGPFNGEHTHPKMIHYSLKKIVALKGVPTKDVYRIIFENTKKFYRLEI